MARVLVVANVMGFEFDEKLYRGFESGLRTEFTRCGIKSEVLHVETDSLEPFKTALARFQPDSVLMIGKAGGGKTIVNVDDYSHANERYFKLWLVNADRDTTYWKTESKFVFVTKALFAENSISGERFAEAIVDRLRDDEVIKHCQMLEEDAKAERDEAAKRARENSGFNIND